MYSKLISVKASRILRRPRTQGGGRSKLRKGSNHRKTCTVATACVTFAQKHTFSSWDEHSELHASCTRVFKAQSKKSDIKLRYINSSLFPLVTILPLGGKAQAEAQNRRAQEIIAKSLPECPGNWKIQKRLTSDLTENYCPPTFHFRGRPPPPLSIPPWRGSLSMARKRRKYKCFQLLQSARVASNHAIHMVFRGCPAKEPRKNLWFSQKHCEGFFRKIL